MDRKLLNSSKRRLAHKRSARVELFGRPLKPIKVIRPPACSCSECISQCRYPGWLKPGDLERIARFLEHDLRELFHKGFHVVDYERIIGTPPIEGAKVFGIAPKISDDYCTFFNPIGNVCTIHQVKPWVCRYSWHHPPGKVPPLTYLTALAWNAPQHQKQIQELMNS